MPSNDHTFVAIYSGDTICSARIIAASADPNLVQHVQNVLFHQQTAPIPGVPTVSRQERRRRIPRASKEEGGCPK